MNKGTAGDAQGSKRERFWLPGGVAGAAMLWEREGTGAENVVFSLGPPVCPPSLMPPGFFSSDVANFLYSP